MLTIDLLASTDAVNLTSVGDIDWKAWLSSGGTDQKTGATDLITFADVGSPVHGGYDDDVRPLSWTDGAVTLEGVSNGGIYNNVEAAGYSVTVPADTTQRILHIYFGGYDLGHVGLAATLSDGGTASDASFIAPAGAPGKGTATIAYAAASAGQTLTVELTMIGFNGNISFSGAALSSVTQIGDGDVQFGTVTVPADCLATLEVKPSGASLLSRSRDPGDRRPIGVNLADVMPADRQIDTIEYLGFDDISGANGMRFDGTGSTRPMVDRDQHRVGVFPRCDPTYQQNAIFSPSLMARPRLRVSLRDSDGNPTPEAIEQSFPFQVEQR